uniref:ATP binding cassette subfamily A member 5 n=1 Tax=Oncorhynchus tshawytscha TaxID=74940 RepID=A0A8C8JD93_ONCTS
LASQTANAGVWHQTKSLLYKNLLIKWRTKQQSLQELILPLLLLCLLILISTLNPHVYYGGISTMELEREDYHLLKGLGYTPINNATNHIMEETPVELRCVTKLQMLVAFYCVYGISGIFYFSSWNMGPTLYMLRLYFCSMQTKRSVWSEMDHLRVVMMGQPGSVEVQKFPHALISIYLVLAFTPFITFLIVNVAAEKEHRLKDTMTMMGLYDSAFWLSWGLLYAALVTTMSILMSIIATYTALFPNSDFIVIFLLIFLYGISSIFFSFMLTPLFKKPKFASTVGSMLTVVFGCLSLFTVLMKDFPQPLVWVLCLLSPSAFSIGIAQVVYLEAQGDGAVFATLANGPHPLYAPLLMLVLDCILYLLLAVYLDQVLPGEFGMRRSLVYFMKPSYWSRRSKRYVEVSSAYETEVNGATGVNESVEPVSPEFRGKEAIRLFVDPNVFMSRPLPFYPGLTFDIYEGQITALLGHSGAGKSTLMNILCGICPPTDGHASIYGSPVAEIAEGAEMRQLVGICPQFNIIFDVLTVEEHLRIFAAIKGILPSDIDNEVSKVLKDLDLEKIMDAQAKNLSGGQKRKLSVGIAILGDPKVILLLDEPTAGMDPCSRHQVWSLLKSRRAGRVTVLSTHYMDEADILADRKAVISQGQLKCVGSSLYLKTKCGVGYHLRMSIGGRCEVDGVTSLVKHHVPKAQLSRQQEAESVVLCLLYLDFTLSGLFSELDCRPDLGIINYGVSMTTLEDVFLRLEAEAEVDQADYSVFNQEQVEDEGDASSLDDTDQRLLTFSDSKPEAVQGHALWRQQFSTVAWLHMLNMQRERKAFVYTLALFLVFLAAVLVLSLATGNIQIHAPERQFLPIYLLRPNQAPRKYTTSLLVQNSSGSDISDFIRNLESQDIKVEMMKNTDYMSCAPHSAAINVTGSNKGFRYSVAFNSTTVHSLPMTVNVLSNAILRGLNGTQRIHTWTKPFDYQIPDATSYALVYIEAIILGMLAIKCRSTLRISGLVPSAYWCGQAAVDIPFYYLILTTMTSILFSFHTANLLTSSNVTAVILCLIGFGPAMILFAYVVSFMFTRVQSNRDFFSVVSMMVRTTIFPPSLPVTQHLYNIHTQHYNVLGLLGPNGAGKSTIMHMLSGDTVPTAGQVLMGDYSTEFRPVDNPLEHIGYCPQVSPLWPRITLEEHLEIYAAIKGLRGQDVPGIITRVVNALELKGHLHKQAKNLSAGIKRKLCFALSMLGNPQIVLLDEPSTGMDPKSKQRMWRAIRAAFKNRQRGAILTTHYMEEAEAVCDRVAIMVSGQLRCIGSIQHLKGKYGRGYSLELKLREELTGLQQVALLHKEIRRIFPHAARQESFATLMVYKIPMEDVKSLAKSFSQLESAKQAFNFEEYNFSQSTLEQVFMEFAKEQENEEEEVGSLSTTFQWQRLRQDGPVPVNHTDSIVHQL